MNINTRHQKIPQLKLRRKGAKEEKMSRALETRDKVHKEPGAQTNTKAADASTTRPNMLQM